MAHEDLGVKEKKHNPGCVTRHISTYIEGNNCSHRWHAAKRARADARINYYKPNATAQLRWNATTSNMGKLATWKTQGKISGLKRKYGGKQSATLKSFATVWWPWNNNAHHIIPRSTLANTLEEISKLAAPNDPKMFDVMIKSLLAEDYNLNEEVNMLMLPLNNDDAIAMGLPRHLRGSGTGVMNHPDYNDEVADVVKAKLEPKYKALATAIKNNKHQKKEKPPAVRSILEGISKTTYNAILNAAVAQRAAGGTDVSLDSIASDLF